MKRSNDRVKSQIVHPGYKMGTGHLLTHVTVAQVWVYAQVTEPGTL